MGLEKVREFIDDAVEVDKKSEMIAVTALHSAAAAGRKEIVEFLISKGANVNAQNGPGQTPLHMAAEKGHLGITQLLVKNGADTDAKDRNGRTPIDLATGAEQRETVEHLQKHEQRFGPKKQAVHDVAIAAVSTQPGCTIGDVISVTIAVNNLGSYAQSFEVELTDSTDGKKIATELAQLGAKNQFESDANLILTGEENGRQNFGDWIEVGDVNGDSYADLLISAAMNDDGRGKAYLYYGGRNMDGTPDKTFAGENKGDHFSDGGGYLADMNNDGFDDVVLGARYFENRGRVYLFFGGPHMDEMPDLVFEPDDDAIGSSFGRGVAVGDLNGDDYNDLIVSAPMQDHGCVYLYFGGEPLDTTVDRIFTGENLVRGFGAVRSARGDVDGDGCDDLLIGTRYGPKRGARARGRAYLFYGARGADMDTAWDVIFEGENDRDEFGTGVDLFDIDNDGHADVIVSARRWNDGEGRAYLYWGGNRDTMDNVPDLYINGELNVMEAFGGDHVVAGYANDDPYGDIVVPAFDYYRFSQHGRVYLYYGDRQSSIDNVYDWTFTGANAGNLTMVARIADFNGDNHGDIVIGGWGFPDNKKQGRVWLYYGGAPSSTDITFNWDTTNASIGKHALKVEIPPVPGEQNTNDNNKTVTVEVKESLR